jgi:hypothetical protein
VLSSRGSRREIASKRTSALGGFCRHKKYQRKDGKNSNPSGINLIEGSADDSVSIETCFASSRLPRPESRTVKSENVCRSSPSKDGHVQKKFAQKTSPNLRLNFFSCHLPTAAALLFFRPFPPPAYTYNRMAPNTAKPNIKITGINRH